MSRKGLSIIANESARRVLGNLGSPLIQVAVRGKVTGNVFAIENLSTSRSMTLPIVASAATKKALGGLADKKGTQNVSLKGRVVSANGTNTLLLDRVDKNLAIVADSSARELLADLAATGSGETTVTAKVVDENGHSYLVLCGNGQKPKGKKK